MHQESHKLPQVSPGKLCAKRQKENFKSFKRVTRAMKKITGSSGDPFGERVLPGLAALEAWPCVLGQMRFFMADRGRDKEECQPSASLLSPV